MLNSKVMFGSAILPVKESTKTWMSFFQLSAPLKYFWLGFVVPVVFYVLFSEGFLKQNFFRSIVTLVQVDCTQARVFVSHCFQQFWCLESLEFLSAACVVESIAMM